MFVVRPTLLSLDDLSSHVIILVSKFVVGVVFYRRLIIDVPWGYSRWRRMVMDVTLQKIAAHYGSGKRHCSRSPSSGSVRAPHDRNPLR
jgi:hypothetical protein